MTRKRECLQRFCKKLYKALRRHSQAAPQQEGPNVELPPALRHEQPIVQNPATHDITPDCPVQTHNIEPNGIDPDTRLLDLSQVAATAEDAQSPATRDPDTVVPNLGTLSRNDKFAAPEPTTSEPNTDSDPAPKESSLPRIGRIIAPELHVHDVSDPSPKRPSLSRLETSIVEEDPANVAAYSGSASNRLPTPASGVSLRRSSSSLPRAIGLHAELRSARIQSPEDNNKHFVPIGKLKHLTSPAKIAEEIRFQLSLLPLNPGSTLQYSETEITNVAEKASCLAPKLFATLTCLKRGLDIFDLLREGVIDMDLPLKIRKDNEIFMVEGHTTVTFKNWSEEEIEEFDRLQWWMTAPIFSKLKDHEFCGREILPFLEVPAGERNHGGRGGFSEVVFRQIHPDHHDFWDRLTSTTQEPFVAIKKLLRPDKLIFENEALMLKKLSSLEDPHIITLLAPFKYGDKYCLIFPRADANLREFWEQRPAPQFDGPTVLWMVEQMAGIVHALSRIHNFSEEDLYGRHGDLKAENILWFSVDPSDKSSMGTLKIADFGLGKFHRQDSRSMSIRASGTTMYLPPEAQLNMSISRAGDIWSLACLYLEFISWVLTDSADIDRISIDSTFFQLVDETHAIVRPEVVSWVQQLRENPRCSALIHNLLDLIMDDALIPDAQKRIRASDLSGKLKILLNRAREDKTFLLEGALRPKKFEPAPTSPQSAIPADDVTDSITGTPPRPRRVQTFPPT